MEVSDNLLYSREARRLHDALQSSTIAYSYFDAADRLVFWNKAYEDLNFRIRSHLRPGAYFPDLLAELVVAGQINIHGGDVQAWVAQRLEARGNGNTSIRNLSDGRDFLVQERRDALGGTLGIWLNVTDLNAAGALTSDDADNREPHGTLGDVRLQTELRDRLQTLVSTLEMLGFTCRSEAVSPLIEECIEEAKAIGVVLDMARM